MAQAHIGGFAEPADIRKRSLGLYDIGSCRIRRDELPAEILKPLPHWRTHLLDTDAWAVGRVRLGRR